MINEKKETNKDNPPLNEINSFKFDQNIFNQPTTEPPKKKGKGKKPKAIDFMDYAQSKGISINIQYEDKQTQPSYIKDKKDFNREFSKPFEQKKSSKPYNEEGKKDDKKGKEKRKNDFEIEIEKDKKRDNKVEYDAFNDYIDNKNYDGYYKDKESYYNNNYNRNYYNNNNYEYTNNGKYKKNYYDYDNNYDYYNNYNNYDDYNKRKKNQIAVEVPDPSEQNTNINNNKNSNQDKQIFSKMNKFDKPNQKIEHPFMFPPQDPNFMNFQAMMRNNMFNPLAMPVNPFMAPHQSFPIRDEEILDFIEYFFSQKNLNKDIFLRDSMDEEGWVNAEIVISNPRLKPFNLTPEKIHSIIDKIGSDFVETRVNEVDKIQLRPRNYDSLKEKLLTKEEIQQKMLAQMPPNMTQPPMGFTPPPMYPPMMNMYMHRPPINPMMFQQMQMGKMPMPVVPVPQPKSEN